MQPDSAQTNAGRAQTNAGRAPSKRRSRADKVRLLSFEDLDWRTRGAQWVQETRSDIIADLGGEERLSTLERIQVSNAAMGAAMLRDLHVRWMKGEAVEPSAVSTFENTFNRTAAALGTQRRAKDVTPDLGTYSRDD
jgi:hypothetical protein